MVMTAVVVEGIGMLPFEMAALIVGEGELEESKEEGECPVWMLASGWVMDWRVVSGWVVGWRVVSGDGGIFRGVGNRRRCRSGWGL